MFLFFKENKWPKQNESCCSRHTRTTMYIHVFYLKTKIYGKITVFKTILQHKQDKEYITFLYHY